MGNTLFFSPCLTVGNIQNAATSLANCFGSVLSLVKNAEPEDTIEERITEIVDTSVKAAQMYANAALNSFKSINKDSRTNFASDFYERTKASTNIYYVLSTEITKRFDEYEWIYKKAIKLYEYAYSYIDSLCQLFYPVNVFNHPLIYSQLFTQAIVVRQSYLVEKNKTTEALQKFQEKAQKIKNQKYWEEHKEEKQALENELNNLTEKLNDLQSKVDAINDRNAPQIAELEAKKGQQTTEEIELDKQRKLIQDLDNQRYSLGIFHGRQKKELTARLEQERSKLDSMQKKAEEAKKIYIDQINNQLFSIRNEGSELRAEISKLSQRQSEIHAEFTKNR